MWRLRRGLECLPSVPFLPSCCHHLDPVVLLTCRRKEKKHLDLLPPLLSFATLAVNILLLVHPDCLYRGLIVALQSTVTLKQFLYFGI